MTSEDMERRFGEFAEFMREATEALEALKAEVEKARAEVEAVADKLSRVCEVHHLWDGS